MKFVKMKFTCINFWLKSQWPLSFFKKYLGSKVTNQCFSKEHKLSRVPFPFLSFTCNFSCSAKHILTRIKWDVDYLYTISQNSIIKNSYWIRRIFCRADDMHPFLKRPEGDATPNRIKSIKGHCQCENFQYCGLLLACHTFKVWVANFQKILADNVLKINK